MSSGAKLGKGILLQMGDGASPEVFTTIAEVVSLSGSPGGVPDQHDVTNHESIGLYEEVITGIIRTKTLNGVANFLGTAASQHNALLTGMDAGTLKSFRLTLPTATPKTFTFSARVMRWDVDTPINGPMRLNFDLKQSGPAVYF